MFKTEIRRHVAVHGSDDEREIVGDTELFLAELGAGHSSPEEFALEIARRIKGIIVIGPPDQPIKKEFAAQVVLRGQWTVEAGTQPSARFASAAHQIT